MARIIKKELGKKIKKKDKFVKVNATDRSFRVTATQCCSYLEKSPFEKRLKKIEKVVDIWYELIYNMSCVTEQ